MTLSPQSELSKTIPIPNKLRLLAIYAPEAHREIFDVVELRIANQVVTSEPLSRYPSFDMPDDATILVTVKNLTEPGTGDAITLSPRLIFEFGISAGNERPA